MFSKLLSRVFARSGAGTNPGRTPPRPELLDLAHEPLLRGIVPNGDYGCVMLVNSTLGLFIINRNDTGVGGQLYNYDSYAPEEVEVMQKLVLAAPADPVVLDIGANIGIVTLELARAAGPRGLVHAFEAQRAMFHMLAGNVALNGLENIHCHHMAVGARAGSARIPRIDYHQRGSFGSLELNRETQSDLGQQALGGEFEEAPMDTIDAMNLARVDMIKIDVEGMEAEVLAGAERTIRAHRPLMYVEHLKSGAAVLGPLLHAMGYTLYDAYENFICVPSGEARFAPLVGALSEWRPEGGAQASAAPAAPIAP
ncbi:MAG: FkbM family methyltransferase [Betaproteobacteria bacterium]|nr:FkbM family methyltransferase [Betaproteobacteria bacterium]